MRRVFAGPRDEFANAELDGIKRDSETGRRPSDLLVPGGPGSENG